MEVYSVKGTYTQSGDQEKFRGELGIDENIIKGNIDDIDQSMLPEPQNTDFRNKVVEGQVYPENNAVYFIKRGFDHTLRNVEKTDEDPINPQEVHVLATTESQDLEGQYNGIWTIDNPEELPVEYLGEDDFELGWELDPQQYEDPDRSAEQLIDEMYDGELPQEPQEINTQAEISRGTTEFTLERLKDQQTAKEDLPLDVINVALSGGVDDQRRINSII